jgi:hypothetical protein
MFGRLATRLWLSTARRRERQHRPTPTTSIPRLHMCSVAEEPVHVAKSSDTCCIGCQQVYGRSKFPFGDSRLLQPELEFAREARLAAPGAKNAMMADHKLNQNRLLNDTCEKSPMHYKQCCEPSCCSVRETPSIKFKSCPCKTVWYCGQVCQKSHWKGGGHSVSCPLKQGSNAGGKSGA